VFAENDYVKKYDLMADEGRKSVTKQDADLHMFRVPTLRNVAVTAPYFHNGKVQTLQEAIQVMAKTQLNKDLAKNEVDDIYNLLVSLNGTIPEQKMPRLTKTMGTTVTPK
jgi:cytochrome c peroxidase